MFWWVSCSRETCLLAGTTNPNNEIHDVISLCCNVMVICGQHLISLVPSPSVATGDQSQEEPAAGKPLLLPHCCGCALYVQ